MGDHPTNVEAMRAEIEALKQRVATLERSEDRLLAVAKSATDFISLLDLDGTFLFINRVFDEYSVDTVIGSSVFDYVSPEEQEVIRRSMEQVLSTRAPVQYTIVHKRPQGDIIEFESRLAPVICNDEVVALTLSSSNMTEQRRTLLDRDQFFLLSIDMFCLVTQDARFKSVSPAFQLHLGHAEDDLMGRRVIDFVHPEDASDMAANLEQLSIDNEQREFESRIVCADGTYKWLSWRTVFDPHLRHVYAVARDVTERRELENQLRQSQKMEAVGQLAGGIAHDFNNLITAILMNAQRSQRDVEPQSKLYRRLEGIVDTCQRCAKLTNKLLTFSRSKVISLRTLDVASLVTEIGSLVQRVLPEYIEFTLSKSAELPPIKGDATQIEQIIVNLCVNARDAMPDGGRIDLDVREVVLGHDECDGHPWVTPGRFVCMSVTDNGCGMSAEVLERAFEPFYTTKQPGRGTGLGLATVYGIAKQHEGLIKLVSEPGEGTRCNVYFPVSKRALTSPSPMALVPAHGGTETLLVAEDEGSLRLVLIEVLREAGYKVLGACNGKEAVELFQKHHRDIALVVLDMIMPQMGGVEAYEWITNVRPGMPVLFCSGYSTSKLHPNHDISDSVPRLLSKPYDIQQMLRAVRAVLDARAP